MEHGPSNVLGHSEPRVTREALASFLAPLQINRFVPINARWGPAQSDQLEAPASVDGGQGGWQWWPGTECCTCRNQPTQSSANEPRKDCVDGATFVCLPFDFLQEVF